MGKTNKVNCFKQNVNGINFYCELRGSGPSIVLVPSGEGDCGSFSRVADSLSDEFTVFTLDMRGCSRSDRPQTWTPMTSKHLASDLAGLVEILKLEPASIYGCSSGGQAVLSLGVYYSKVARNLMVHEAALFDNRASLQTMGDQLTALIRMRGSKKDAFLDFLRPLIGDEKAWETLDPDYLTRIKENGDVFFDLIFPSAAERVYTDEELLKMPPLIFSVGQWNFDLLEHRPNPIIGANLNAAKRGNCDVVKLPGGHYPQITHPDILTKYIREQTKRYL